MRQRGFTYIEGSVVIATILLISAIMMPSFVRQARNRSVRLFKVDMQSLAKQGRYEAIQTGHTFGLTYDKAENALKLVEEFPDDDTQQQKLEFPELPLPEGIDAKRFDADQNESPADGWRVPLFADGTTAGGGIEFSDGDQSFSLVIDRGDFKVRVVDGPVPDLSLDRWQAGTVAPRSQTNGS